MQKAEEAFRTVHNANIREKSAENTVFLARKAYLEAWQHVRIAHRKSPNLRAPEG